MSKERKLPRAPSEDESADDAVIGRALKGSLIIFGVVAVVVGTAVWFLSRTPEEQLAETSTVVAPQLRAKATVEPPTIVFRDVTDEAGVDFVHGNGARGEKLLPETMGGGVAFFDYDNDGHQDLFFVNSAYWPGEKPAGEAEPKMALYRNDGNGSFTDVTAEAGLDVSFYGMGVAVGDYDNDGNVDLFITALGKNRLYRNLGGRFVDVTDEMGVGGEEDAWSTSAGFFDFNNDGRLDLFVCNYVNWSREFDLAQGFTLTGGERAYGPPRAFEGTFSYLYRNDKDRFEDVSMTSGIQIRSTTGKPMGKSLGVVPIDLDGDGWMDFVVANDTVQNFVFWNQRDGTFLEIGASSGIAFDSAGNARGAMGIDAARFRDDESLGIGIGNFANEMTALYVAQANRLQFVDDAISTGLGPPTRLLLTFGLFFFDYDLDGRLDLFAANGHLEDEIQKVQATQRYEQPPQLFWNCGVEQPMEFMPVDASRCGEDFVRPMVGRGAAFADIDGDGDLDVVLAAVGAPPRLLRNDQDLGRNWIRLKLVGTTSNRDAIGSWIEVHVGESILRRQVMPTRSYLSQCELPVTIGIGDADSVDRVLIRWPDSTTQELSEVPLNRETRVEQIREEER